MTESQPPATPDATHRQVDEIANRYVEDYADVDPVLATHLGISGHDGELTDLSWEGFERRAELTRSAFAAMRSVEPADARDAAARSSFLERLGVQIDQIEALRPQTTINNLSSELHDIRGAFDLMPQE